MMGLDSSLIVTYNKIQDKTKEYTGVMFAKNPPMVKSEKDSLEVF